MSLEFTGERFVPEIQGDIRLEHMHRYLSAGRLTAGKRVLDIACGEGYGSRMLASAARSVIGVDIDEASIAHARKNYSGPNTEFLIGSATDIPIPGASVDVVVSFETIEHLVDHETMMREIKRVLAPDGVLVLSSPDRHEYSDVPNYKNPFHLRELYLPELSELLGRHFENQAIYGQRVHYASILAPVGMVAAPVSSFLDGDMEITERPGLPNPVYFIAVCSDGALPKLSAGLFIPNEPSYLKQITSIEASNERLLRENAELSEKLQRLQYSDRSSPKESVFRQGLRQGGDFSARAVARWLYRKIPLSLSSKIFIKGLIFKYSGPAFRSSGAYKRWQAATAVDINLTDARSPGLQDAVATHSAVGTAPAIADGSWEWKTYVRTQERIQSVSRLQRSPSFRPRSIINVDVSDLTTAAARINLPDPGAAPDVSIIVPVFNEIKTTIECLLSLCQTTGSISFEVLLANDASTDDTNELLARIPHLRLINQPENLGFLRNCNVAAKYARGRRLVFLNNDAQVSATWLVELIRALDDPSIGAVGPRFVYPNGVLQEAGVKICRKGSVEMIGHGDEPERLRWSYDRDVDYVSGACMMLDAALFHELGGFNDDLAPAYCEDLDLCLRIREKGFRIVYVYGAEVIHHLSKSSNVLGNTYKHRLITKNMQYLSERYQATFDKLDDLRVIAMYLPQFHPIKENNLWWGPGFTEWSNVTKARPNFAGHDQPRLAADLGYYDLRLPEVMEAQWGLADRYGIDGFCYYYYWFKGHRLLQRPLDRLLDINATAKPFCLCWANENWTRRWDGQDREVLMAQDHSEDDDLGVIRDLVRYMEHPAYIRIRGKPLLVVYRTDLFPSFSETAARWREECRKLGLGEIYIAMVESFRFASENVAPSFYGCDASIEFPAHNVPQARQADLQLTNPQFGGHICDYDDVVAQYSAREHPGYTRFRTVMPGWDNTARRQNHSLILNNSSPGAFQAWTEFAIKETKRDLQGEERLLFVNAWNEWAEGAYLEPDRRFGHSYLQAVRNARDSEFLMSEKSRSRWN